VSLSEQQLVDCSGAYGNNGCNGGWMDSAFQYVRDNGLSYSNSYPYVAVNQNCRANGGPFRISGFTDVPTCTNTQNALSITPISVAVDASNWSFYRGGVFNNCGTAVNHGVLLVGIDNNGNWNIKNSWSNGWGENGFIRLAPGNTCAVCGYGSYPNL
jgi:C1A family cysteine protease